MRKYVTVAALVGLVLAISLPHSGSGIGSAAASAADGVTLKALRSVLDAAIAPIDGRLDLPDHSITPGAIASSDVAAICTVGYARSTRPPYNYAWRQFRDQVFAAYGIPIQLRREYTVDHLVPLELGGAPMDLRNVWPEPRAAAKRKDEVEDALHAAVCYTHSLTLEQAQSAIARDWTHTPVGLPALRDHHYNNGE